MTKFYTGLDGKLCQHIFNTVADIHSSKLSKIQEFFIVLIKCRLNLLEQDLGYRFGVSQSTISRIFRKWIPVMTCCLTFLIKWPAREDLLITMPSSFREHFPKCVIILNSFY